MKTPKKPTINAPLPVEAPAPIPDKPLDTKALQEAVQGLNRYTEERNKTRLMLGAVSDQLERSDMAEFLLQAEEQYLQSLKNKVAALIQGATRIA